MTELPNILKRIVQVKKAEIAVEKIESSIFQLMAKEGFMRKCISAKQAISTNGASGVIAEFKRKSPSKGIINNTANPEEVVSQYQNAGASMVSVLTDGTFFGAQTDDFKVARECLKIPLLRKEFIIDPYQIYQSKAMGADVILLIASILTPKQAKDLAFLANDFGMEVLLEIHDESELGYINKFVDMIGVNNRNLKDFSVNTEQALKLSAQLPSEIIRVAESGLNSFESVLKMKESGFQAFLIGEYFMKNDLPGEACKRLIKKLSENQISNTHHI